MSQSLQKANTTLAITQKSSEELVQLVQSLAKEVKESCVQLESEVGSMKESEKGREEMLKGLKEEIDSMKSMMPKVNVTRVSLTHRCSINSGNRTHP